MSLSVLIFMVLLGRNTYMELSYAGEMPAAPDLASDRTMPIAVNHNTWVYVTNKEYRAKKQAASTLFIAGGFCFALIAFLQIKYKVF